MDAVFQPAQNAVFDLCLMVFGVPCTWVNASVTDSVLFNVPTENQRFNVISGRGVNHVGYDNADILRPYIEFRDGQFINLGNLVYGDGNPTQYVIINGIKYVCIQLKAFFDGKTYRIGLQIATTDELLPGV